MVSINVESQQQSSERHRIVEHSFVVWVIRNDEETDVDIKNILFHFKQIKRNNYEEWTELNAKNH